MRVIAALIYYIKGDFYKALQAVMFEPSDISKFYTAKGLENINKSAEGIKLIQLQRLKHNGISQPNRLILLAQIYVAREEFEHAVHALDQAEKMLGREPGIQAGYCHQRACSSAALGKAAEAMNYIERARAIAAQFPKRSSFWETHYFAGKSFLYLGRYSDALAELNEARRFAFHPIEKHSTAYRSAKINEDAGNLIDAIPLYQIVAADPIPSWMRKRAT